MKKYALPAPAGDILLVLEEHEENVVSLFHMGYGAARNLEELLLEIAAFERLLYQMLGVGLIEFYLPKNQPVEFQTHAVPPKYQLGLKLNGVYFRPYQWEKNSWGLESINGHLFWLQARLTNEARAFLFPERM